MTTPLMENATKIIYIGMLLMNAWFSESFGEADNFKTPITPPGYTFSVWGVIFIAMGLMTTKFADEQKFPLVSWNIAQICVGAWPAIFSAISSKKSQKTDNRMYRFLLICSVLTLASVVINAYICWSSEYNSETIRIGSGLLLGWTLAATMLNIAFTVKYWDVTDALAPASDRYLAVPFYAVGGAALWWMSTQPKGWTMMITLVWALVNSMIAYFGSN